MEQLLDCVTRGWRPGIGDPSAFAWTIVAIYALAAILAFMVALKRPFPAASWRRERFFWLLVAFAMAALAVNKQLDLQSLLTTAGRCLAVAQGWYGQRRLVQMELVIGLGLVAVLTFLVAALVLRGTLQRTALPLLGLVFVGGFVMIRAAGFHHVDVLINQRLADVRVNWLLEVPGPLLVSLSAVWLLARRRV